MSHKMESNLCCCYYFQIVHNSAYQLLDEYYFDAIAIAALSAEKSLGIRNNRFFIILRLLAKQTV